MDSRFMSRAISLAIEAGKMGEIPVGAVIVKDGEIIAEGKNFRERSQSALGHAEIDAITAACKKLNSWRLDGCTLYVTLEPCVMCTGAIINARISEVVFGAYDLARGCMDSVINLCDLKLGHRPQIYGGIREDECKALLTDFFKAVRE